jgi:hypothetical protein
VKPRTKRLFWRWPHIEGRGAWRIEGEYPIEQTLSGAGLTSNRNAVTLHKADLVLADPSSFSTLPPHCISRDYRGREIHSFSE